MNRPTCEAPGLTTARASLRALATLLRQQEALGVRIAALKEKVKAAVLVYGPFESAGVPACMLKVPGGKDNSKAAILGQMGVEAGEELWSKLPQRPDRQVLKVDF